MKLTKCDINEAKKFYKRTKIYNLLCEFRDSDMTCARVDETNYSSAGVGAQTIRKSAQRFKFYDILVISHNGKNI